MRLPFVKMHGAGNDYVFVDGFETPLPPNPIQLAPQISHRHFGIGSDGLVFLIPPPDACADVQMRMWNADGSEGSMCGNAARCVALWMRQQQRTANVCRIRTNSGIVPASVLTFDKDQLTANVAMEMPVPEFASGHDEQLEGVVFPTEPRIGIRLTALSIGNPHAVIFVDEWTDHLVRDIGRQIGEHHRFPGGVNVEWVRVVSSEQLQVRVWERGSGETLACGSGACAAVAAAIRQGYCRRDAPVDVILPGGNVTVRWAGTPNTADETLILTGPASVSFQGVWIGPEPMASPGNDS